MRWLAPLRVRLTLAFAVAMAIVLCVLGWYVHHRLSTVLLNAVDQDLKARTDVVVRAVAQHEPSLLDGGSLLIDPDEAFGQVLAPDGVVLESTTAVAVAPMLSPADVRSVSAARFLTRHVQGVGDPARLLAVPAETPDGPVVVVLGATLGDRNDALDELSTVLLVGGPVVLLLASLGAWLLAGAALRPVARMASQAAVLSEDDPATRLDVPATRDELQHLGETLNDLLERLHEAMEREHRFVDEASHELRTPLAILKAELDLAIIRPRTPDQLDASLRAASAETDRLVALAEDLLVLARIRRGRLPVQRVDVQLPELLQRSADVFRGTARDASVCLEVSAPPENVRVDPMRVEQALTNLLDNALRHGRPRRIQLTAERSGETVHIAVTDDGVGFPTELQGRAFDPFARHGGEAVGGRGAGLGLAIVHAVAEAHGGSASISSSPLGETRVELVLPC